MARAARSAPRCCRSPRAEAPSARAWTRRSGRFLPPPAYRQIAGQGCPKITSETIPAGLPKCSAMISASRVRHASTSSSSANATGTSAGKATAKSGVSGGGSTWMTCNSAVKASRKPRAYRAPWAESGEKIGRPQNPLRVHDHGRASLSQNVRPFRTRCTATCRHTSIWPRPRSSSTLERPALVDPQAIRGSVGRGNDRVDLSMACL